MLTSNQYSWNDISVSLGGRVLFGCRGIKVEHGYEHEVIHAMGGKGHAINEKNFTVSGSIKVLQSEYDNFVKSFGKNYQRRYFTILWVFERVEDAMLNSHEIKHAKLGRVNLEKNQGDAFMEIEIPFVALDVEINKG